jgi:hypothetical protein
VNKADRVILLFLVLGVWGVCGALWFGLNTVDADIVCNTNNSIGEKHKHGTNDIAKFKWKVRRIVEDCSVTEGEILC